MLASIPEFREVDFSHLTITDTPLESVEPSRKQKSPFVWFALLISLILHLSLLLLNFNEKHVYTNKPQAQTLHIDLRQLPSKKQDIAPEVITQEVADISPAQEAEKEIVVSPVPKEKIVAAVRSEEAKPVARLVLEPLSSQELAEIIDSRNAQTDYQGSAAIAENVFHPGLRARLSEEASKPLLARVEDSGPQTYTDPSGATVVVLGNGKCLKSPMSTKIGAPQNWYMTSCGGKSESEKIMDRVNESVHGKLGFEE